MSALLDGGGVLPALLLAALASAMLWYARTAPDHRQREVRPWRRAAEKELRGL
jgi:hypothetical protein